MPTGWSTSTWKAITRSGGDAGVIKQCEEIRKQRQISSLLELVAYCRAINCPAREVRIHVKDYDSALLGLVAKDGLRCPACHKKMALHEVLTAEQADASDARHARASVNRQMRSRDLKCEGHPRFECAKDMTDDRLPLTPDGWFDNYTLQPASMPRRRFVKGEDR